MNEEIAKLINERNELISRGEDEATIGKLEEIIAEKEAEENRKILIENFKPLADNPETINLQEMWKLNSKLWPKTSISLPVGKKNFKGKVVSSPSDIKNVLALEYKNRLSQV